MNTKHEELVDEIEKYVLSENFKQEYLPADVYLIYSREYSLSKYTKKRRADFKAIDESKNCLIIGESKTVRDKKIVKKNGDLERRFSGQLQTYLQYLSEIEVSHLVYGVPLTMADIIFYSIQKEAKKMNIKGITVHIITINHVYKVKTI